MEIKGNTFEPGANWTVHGAITYAINVAKQWREPLHVLINGIKFTVAEKSDVDTVRNSYLKAFHERQRATK